MADAVIDELAELTRLYQIQSARVGVQVAIEQEAGSLDRGTRRELELSMRMLTSLAQVKKDLGIAGGPHRKKSLEIRDLKGYSRKTAEVLSRPESRRRVISIVERITRGIEEEQRGKAQESLLALPEEAAE